VGSAYQLAMAHAIRRFFGRPAPRGQGAGRDPAQAAAWR
jgi:hypothetical protein